MEKPSPLHGAWRTETDTPCQKNRAEFLRQRHSLEVNHSGCNLQCLRHAAHGLLPYLPYRPVRRRLSIDRSCISMILDRCVSPPSGGSTRTSKGKTRLVS